MGRAKASVLRQPGTGLQVAGALVLACAVVGVFHSRAFAPKEQPEDLQAVLVGENPRQIRSSEIYFPDRPRGLPVVPPQSPAEVGVGEEEEEEEARVVVEEEAGVGGGEGGEAASEGGNAAPQADALPPQDLSPLVSGPSQACVGVQCDTVRSVLAAHPTAWAHHPLLVHTLTLCCSPERPSLASSFARRTLRPSHVDVVLAPKTPRDKVFASLRAPHPQDRASVVYVDMRTCNVARGVLDGAVRKFVLVGPFAQTNLLDGSEPVGALSGGPDAHAFPSLWIDGAKVGHMRLEDGTQVLGLWGPLYLSAVCDKDTVGRLLGLLDHDLLVAWFVHQGSFLLKRPGDLSWSTHPKIINLPGGSGHEQAVFRAAMKFLDNPNALLSARPNLVAPWAASTTGVRKFLSEQFRQLYADTGVACGEGTSQLCEGREAEELWSSQFAVSPPGPGCDTPTTWDALLAGAFPVVWEGCGVDESMRDLPSITVTDLAVATPNTLTAAHALITGDTAAQWFVSGVPRTDASPLFAPYWDALIEDLAAGRTTPLQWKTNTRRLNKQLMSTPVQPPSFQVDEALASPESFAHWLVASTNLPTPSVNFNKALERAKTLKLPWDLQQLL